MRRAEYRRKPTSIAVVPNGSPAALGRSNLEKTEHFSISRVYLRYNRFARKATAKAKIGSILLARGCSLVVKQLPSKQWSGVRFFSPAQPTVKPPQWRLYCKCFRFRSSTRKCFAKELRILFALTLFLTTVILFLPIDSTIRLSCSTSCSVEDSLSTKKSSI